MKTKFHLMILALLMTLPMMAGKIKVVSGDLSVFNNPDVTALIKFDYTDLRIEGKPYMQHLKSKGADYVRDWPNESLTAETWFVNCFNKDNKKGMQVSASGTHEYTMVIVAKEMHMGSGAASMLVGFGAGGASLSGMMYLMKNGSDIPVLTVNIDNQTGRSAMTELARRTDLYGELAEDMVDAIKDTKQSKVPAATEPVKLNLMTSSGNATAETTTHSTKTAKESVSKEATPVKEQSQVTTSSSSGILAKLKEAQGKNIERRRKPVTGDFDIIAEQNTIGLYIDFSDAEIDDRTESGFIRYMASEYDEDDFKNKWENEIKPDYVSTFCAKVNDKLKRKKGVTIRFKEDYNYKYVLKIQVVEVDDDGDNRINFLFVDTNSGEVVAQITCEADSGSHARRLSTKIGVGIENAADEFADELLGQIK